MWLIVYDLARQVCPKSLLPPNIWTREQVSRSRSARALVLNCPTSFPQSANSWGPLCLTNSEACPLGRTVLMHLADECAHLHGVLILMMQAVGLKVENVGISSSNLHHQTLKHKPEGLVFAQPYLFSSTRRRMLHPRSTHLSPWLGSNYIFDTGLAGWGLKNMKNRTCLSPTLSQRRSLRGIWKQDHMMGYRKNVAADVCDLAKGNTILGVPKSF